MTAQTIAQAKAVPETLWHFLLELPQTQEANIFYALVIGGLAGTAIHYAVKWAQGDIAGSLWRYMFTDNPRRSWLAISILLTELVGEIGAGMFTTSTGDFVGWGIVLLSGFKSGFTVDSIANKGERPVWTDTQRKHADAPTAALPITGDKT